MSAPSPQGRILASAWLSEQLLAVVLSTTEPTLSSAGWRLLIGQGGRNFERRARWLSLTAGHQPEAGGLWPWLLTISLPPERAGTHLTALALTDGRREIELEPQTGHYEPGPPARLGAACRERFDADVRARVHQVLATVPRTHGTKLTVGLAANLATLRMALREPLPSTKVGPGPFAARLESVTAIDAHAFWLSGWIHDAAPEDVVMTVVSPEGACCELTPEAVSFHPRPSYSAALRDDHMVRTLGFHAYCELEDPSLHPGGWAVEFRTRAGRAFEHVLAKPVQTDIDPVYEALHRSLPPSLDETTFEHQVLPALTSLRRGSRAPTVARVLDFGEIPGTREVSIVLAASDLESIQHQLIPFSGDPDVLGSELLVVAHGADTEELAELATGLHELHQVPFRLLALSHPTRPARALNLGAAIARADLLVLMTSDVLPAAPGWLEPLRASLVGSNARAAVGPKLLYEDDSIAHAGADYRPTVTGHLRRTLPFAGLARGIEVANRPRTVAALSGSCLMVRREVFLASGGFADLYLAGGDEGGDLSLRLASAGELAYVPGSELYLLAESPPDCAPTEPEAAFNHWLFERRREQQESEAWPESLVPEPSPAATADGTRRSLVDVLSVETEPADGRVISDGGLVEPGRNEALGIYDGTFALVVDGWAQSAGPDPVTVEIGCEDEVLWRGTPGQISTGWGAAPPREHDFRAVIGSLALPPQFRLAVETVTPEGVRATLGQVTGRRSRLSSGYQPRLQALCITTIGRSGSTWLADLLWRHPAIVSLRDPGYEPVLAAHSMDTLVALSSPDSYGMALNPLTDEPRWWLGDGRQGELPASNPSPLMARWLGAENPRMLAAFFQRRLDLFYGELARQQGRRRSSRYFAEKVQPGGAPRLLSELYPEGREIVLVRDPRDMVCSIRAYNQRRGIELWGRHGAATEEDWLEHMGSEMRAVLAGWHERRQTAHLVRYEDLIAEPRSVLDRLFAFLHLDVDDDGIEVLLEEASAVHAPVLERHQTSPSIEQSIGRFARELSPELLRQCEEVFAEPLAELGYQAGPAEAASSEAAPSEATSPDATSPEAAPAEATSPKAAGEPLGSSS